MTVKNTSWFRLEDVDVNSLDATKLLQIVEQCEFPELTITYPDYSKMIDIAGISVAWEDAVWYLSRAESLGTDMLKYAYFALYDWLAGLEKDSLARPSIVSSIFNERKYLVLDEANKRFADHRNFSMCEYYRVCLMLTLAEQLRFPEFTIHWHKYHIQGDMESWLNAAKVFFGQRAVVWVIKRLMAKQSGAFLLKPIEYKNKDEEYLAVNGSSSYDMIDMIGFVTIWKQTRPIW